MSKLKIGVSGDIGSFSEEAGEEYIRNHKLDAEIKRLVSVENVLKALDKGEINIGVFPIENSNGGIVFEAVNAMSHHIFKIKEYFEIDVNHSLIAKDTVNIEDIRKIASHDQALRQCRTYLKRNWPKVDLIDAPDTAGSAKKLSEGGFGDDTAVIAAARCAEMYPRLKVAENKIQDLKFNFTTFLAVEK